MSYTVKQELGIPRHLLEREIKPSIFKAFGLAPDGMTPQQILLAQVEIIGMNTSGDCWNVRALVADGVHPEGVQVGEIDCDPGTSKDGVLMIADRWIRESEKSEFVPGHPLSIPFEEEEMEEYAVWGVTLVRAAP